MNILKQLEIWIQSLLEYCDNYSDSFGNLWHFKRDEKNMNNENIANVTTADSSYFRYKSSILGNLVAAAAANGVLENAKIDAPLKDLSNIFRSLEIPLINCKIHLELNWTKNCVMSSIDGATAFQITSTKLYVPIIN